MSRLFIGGSAELLGSLVLISLSAFVKRVIWVSLIIALGI
jgi:hypothetical protein